MSRLERDYRNAEARGSRFCRRIRAGGEQEGLGSQVGKVKIELLTAVSGIERGSGRGRANRKKGRSHFGAVGKDDGNAVAATDAMIVETDSDRADQLREPAKGQRVTSRSADRRGGGPLS